MMTSTCVRFSSESSDAAVVDDLARKIAAYNARIRRNGARACQTDVIDEGRVHIKFQFVVIADAFARFGADFQRTGIHGDVQNIVDVSVR